MTVSCYLTKGDRNTFTIPILPDMGSYPSHHATADHNSFLKQLTSNVDRMVLFCVAEAETGNVLRSWATGGPTRPPIVTLVIASQSTSLSLGMSDTNHVLSDDC